MVMFKEGLEAIARETDSEITVTAWNADGRGSGWAGGASRNWETLQPLNITRRAIELTERSRDPQGLEPGRYTAILGPEASLQFVSIMEYALNARFTDMGKYPFSQVDGRNRLGQQVLDNRLTLSSDPADNDGGYVPFTTGVADIGANSLTTPGLPLIAQTWIEKGKLINLAYDPLYAASRGKAPHNQTQGSLRLSGTGALSTLEEMIASCERGIYVNRFSGVQVIDNPSGMVSGVTRDGCFFVRNGKIERPVKNFRFLESPFHALNRLEAIGTTARRAFVYTPRARSWPLPPMMVPPLMIRDFNFAALADAV